MTRPPGNTLSQPLSALLTRLGLHAVATEEITSIPSRKTGRCTHRLRLADGRFVKGRHFMSPALAAVAERIHQAVALPWLPQVLGREGEAMLEAWVEGDTMAVGDVPPAMIHQCGRMLGQLHACPLPEIADTGFTPLTLDDWCDKLVRNLNELRQARVLTDDHAAYMRDLAMEHRPSRSDLRVAHRDFCPENLVVAADGRIVSIDNGSLTVSEVVEDLCRVWYLWPMAPAERDAFAQGYSEYGDPAAFLEPSAFWVIVVVTNSARVRLGRGAEPAAAVMVRLGRYLPTLSTGMTSCVLSLQGLQIDVHSNRDRPLRWLGEFMGPFLPPQPQPVRQLAVHVTIDAARYATRVAAGPDQPTGEMDCFTMDSQYARHTLWQSSEREHVLHLDEARTFLTIDRATGNVDLLARTDRKAMRSALMRVVRELATLHALARGGLLMHAAAVVWHNRAIVIAGQKLTGKTTMLLYTLKQAGMRLLSNDRVILACDGDAPTAHGMPTIVKVRMECLRHLPGIELPDWPWPHRHYLTLDECEAGSELLEPQKHRFASMSPAQFCRWLGTTPVHAAPMGAFVFPRVTSECSGFELRRLTVDEAAERLLANRFPLGPTGPMPEVFADVCPEAMRDEAGCRRRCERVARACACYDCLLGREAYATPELVQAIIAGLGAAG